MTVLLKRSDASRTQTPSIAAEGRITLRACICGLIACVLLDIWIEYAELIMAGKQGHTALVNTAIPVGPFFIIFVLAGVNLLCRTILPSYSFSRTELLTVYVMMTTSCVVASSGQLQFLIPTLTALWHYATTENGWSTTIQPFAKHWMAQTDPQVLRGFYNGRTSVPIAQWAPQAAAWLTFMAALLGASLCIVSILRRQWVDREHLTFPTLALPLAAIADGAPLLRQRLFWLGFLIPFSIVTLNTLAANVPDVPSLSLRSQALFPNVVLSPPFNALQDMQVSLYPFVVGIAYFAPLDVSFSCWFFYIVTLAEKIFGVMAGYNTQNGSPGHSSFPFIGNQGAGAFIGLSLFSLISARSYLKEVFLKAIGRNKELNDDGEPMSYRSAFVFLAVCLTVMVGFCVAGGMNVAVAILVILLGLLYFIAATRIRADTGDAWLSGPDIDVNTLMTRTVGSGLLTTPDLTVLAFVRAVISNSDLRCIAMPHQMEAFKMAHSIRANQRSLTKAILCATVIGLCAAFFTILFFYHHYGAEVGTDTWRTAQGRVPFDNLTDLMRNREGPDFPGLGGVLFGLLVTGALIALRARFLWWPLHPAGYVIATTYTINMTWLPFFAAWLAKLLVLRYGGGRLYRMSQPLFLGLIAGDLLGGALFTAIGALTGISVYPVNW